MNDFFEINDPEPPRVDAAEPPAAAPAPARDDPFAAFDEPADQVRRRDRDGHRRGRGWRVVLDWLVTIVGAVAIVLASRPGS